jgi:glycosyltransferase involved in cell wall biosynthesis
MQELGRIDHWWDCKIPPVLAFSYAAALIYQVPAANAMGCLALIVFVELCAVSYVDSVNGAFDIRAGGKAALALLLGFAPAIFFPFSRLSVALLAVMCLLPAVSTIPALRMKERGALSICFDSLGAYAVPCLFAISMMANQAARPAAQFARLAPFLAAAAFLWALCLGIKRIVIGEFQDRASDLQAGVSTLATPREFQSVRLAVNRVYSVELLAFLGVLAALLPVAPILSIAAVAYFLTLWVKVSRNLDFFVYSRTPSATVQWWQFSHPFYECYFPLILSLQLAWRHPWLAFLPVLQILAFRNNIYRRLGELRMFLYDMFVLMISGGQLHLDGGAEALLHRAGRDGARVEIGHGGSQPWHIRLLKPYRPLRACQSYTVRLEARSNSTRTVTVGVWQNHAPWLCLGLSQTEEISTDWAAFDWTFDAAENEEHAYLGLWLGGATGTLDVRRFSMHQLGTGHEGREGPRPDPRTPYRIFVGATQWNLTGVNVYSEHLVRGLQSKGFDARILMTERQTNLVEASGDLLIPPDDVRVEDLPVAASASWSAHWVALVRYLSRQAPCVFIPNADYRHSCVSPKLPPGVAIVGIVHSDDPLHYEHVARLGRYWDAIVCVSDTVACKVAKMDASLIPRLHVISNGLPVPESFPKRTRDVSDTAQRLRVIYHGGLNTHQKRILDVAAILNECARRGIPVQMTVAGEGTERDALLQACEAHIRSGAFQYRGLLPHDEIESLLRQHDVYLLPSNFEGLPFALLEAMANGCVPLVTDIESAIPELIRHGVNGFRVPVGDIAAFADHLQILQADPDLRARLGAASHATVLGSKYDVGSMVDSYLQLFDQVLEAARTGSYRRVAGHISPPPREVAGISIFPVDHEREVENAERWLAWSGNRRTDRLKRLLNHFAQSN